MMSSAPAALPKRHLRVDSLVAGSILPPYPLFPFAC